MRYVLSGMLIGGRWITRGSFDQCFAAVTVLLTFLFLARPAHAALALTVVGGTSTQIVFSYHAPNPTPCKIEVSESASYRPLVHDVDPALFPGADSDSRPGSFTAGTSRIVVLGRRTTERTTDGHAYSRALQANTTHYYRVTCGSEVATGSAATMNIPLGFTRGEMPLLDPKIPGAYIWPTLSPTDRSQKIIDPLTGSLIRRLSLPGDYPSGAVGGTSAGFTTRCNDNISTNGFFHCVTTSVPGGGPQTLYGIKPDGTVRYLGQLYFFGQSFGLASGVIHCNTFGLGSFLWDETDPNIYYCGAQDSGGALVLVKVTYTGKDAEVAPQVIPGVGGVPAALSVVNLTPAPDTLAQKIARFDPAFDPTKFNCGVDSIQGRYGMIACRRGSQDSYSWLFVLDLGDKAAGHVSVVAGLKMWEQAATRWCTNHTMQDVGHIPLMSVATQIAKGQGLGYGPYLVTLQTPMPASASKMSINVTSACPPGFPACRPGDPVTPSFEDRWLMAVQPGDVFYLGGEIMRIVAKPSNTQWVVERGFHRGVPPTAHQPGDMIQMFCNAFPPGYPYTLQYVYWKFLDAPRGNPDRTKYGIRTNAGASHDVFRPDMWASESGVVVFGSLMDPDNWSRPLDYTVSLSPTFAGAVGPADGNTYPRHAGYHQVKAPPSQRHWFADVLGFTGYNPGPAAAQVDGDVYRYSLSPDVFPNGLHRRQLPTLAVSEGRPLRDKSGPGSMIQNVPADDFTYCVALTAGECRSDGRAGSIYIKVPGLDPTKRYCFAAETSQLGSKDICIGDAAMHGPGVPQYWPQKGMVDTKNSSVRVLTRLFLPFRWTPSTSNPKILPDASWLIYGGVTWASAPGQLSQVHMLMVKTLPQPAPDGVDRSTFIPVKISVAAPTIPGVSTAVIEFGYHEHGAPADHYCTSRAEACVAMASTLVPSTPFKFKTTEAYGGMPCAKGCTIVMPAIPQRVVYWAVKYLNARGMEIGAGERGVAIESAVGSLSGRG